MKIIHFRKDFCWIGFLLQNIFPMLYASRKYIFYPTKYAPVSLVFVSFGYSRAMSRFMRLSHHLVSPGLGQWYHWPRSHVNDDISITIQTWWEFISLQFPSWPSYHYNFCTYLYSCSKFEVTTVSEFGWGKKSFLSKSNCAGKIINEMGSRCQWFSC